jgi:hypothetical protein
MSKDQRMLEEEYVKWILDSILLDTFGLCSRFDTIDWLIDYDGVRLTSQKRGHHWPIVHPPGECEQRAVVVMMLAGDNSWLVYQSSLAILPAEPSGASRRNGRRMRILHIQYIWYINRYFTCHKILRYGTSSFTSHLKEGVLRNFIVLKNRLGLNLQPFGPVASTQTTMPPRQQNLIP